MTCYFETSLICLGLEILEIDECTSHDFFSKHHFNELSMSAVSSKVEWPLSRFIIFLGNCQSDYKFGIGFAAKYCTDLGFKLDLPNFVLEKKPSSFYFFVRKKKNCPRRNDMGVTSTVLTVFHS